MNSIPDIELELDDRWIDAIPENPYDLCPCGCGKKWKFAKENLTTHESNWRNSEVIKIKSEIVLA